MATKVRLFGRTGLPPSRVGAVAPGELPQATPGSSTLGAVAEVAGELFDSVEFKDIRKSRAANEQSEFLGSVDSALAEFEAFVAENPGMTQEELYAYAGKLRNAIILWKSIEANGFDKDFLTLSLTLG